MYIKRQIKALWEAHHPWLFALLAASVFAKFGLESIVYFETHRWSKSALFSSVFDLASITVAFVFAFFTFARTSETEFIHAMRKTRMYRRFLNFLLTAIYANGAVVVVTIPFIVVEPGVKIATNWSYWGLVVWVALVVFALFATIRSVRQFVVIAMVEKNE